MNSANKENKSYDEEAEDYYSSRKVNACKLSSEGKRCTDIRMPIKGSVPKSTPLMPVRLCLRNVSSPAKSSKYKQSSDEDANVFSGKSKSTAPEHSTMIEKEFKETKLSGMIILKIIPFVECGK